MSILNHNIYDNIRTRAIVLHRGSLLLNPPDEADSGWRLPGGGLSPDESLSECVIREVFEETGIEIRVLSVAFLREWVVPKYCVPPEGNTQAGFGLEVFMHGCPVNDSAVPRSERRGLPASQWMPLEKISSLPLWPKEIKALATVLISGQTACGVPSFVSKLESPWEEPIEPVVFNVPVA